MRSHERFRADVLWHMTVGIDDRDAHEWNPGPSELASLLEAVDDRATHANTLAAARTALDRGEGLWPERAQDALWGRGDREP